MGIYQGKFLMSILFGVCIATLRLLLLSFNVGYNPVDYGVYKGAYGLLVEGLSLYGNDEAYSKVPPAAKNTNPRTTANTRPYNPNGRLNPV